MSAYFTINITYKGIQKQLTARLIPTSYSHRFEVPVDGVKLVFELDEESQYRLIKMPWQTDQDILKIDKELIKEIIENLKSLAV